MLRGTAARRYAEAVFSLALEGEQASGQERPGLEQWQGDLATLASVVQDDDVRAFLESPRVSASQRREALGRVLRDRVNGLALNLAFMLVDRDRVAMLPAIGRQFGVLVDRYRGVLEAEATTAVPLSEAQRLAVVARLEQMTGKTIVLGQRVDPSLLGGVVLRVGDTLIDDSVAHRLEGLKSALTSARRGK